MTREEIRPLIEKFADKYGIPPEIIYGVCMTESALDPDAVRYEQAFYRRYTEPMELSDTEEHCRAISWGLMQIMGQVARELGYKGTYLATLCSDPELNLDLGCRFLAEKIRLYGLERGILAYNSGKPRINADGTYMNQYYLDRVLRHSKGYG